MPNKYQVGDVRLRQCIADDPVVTNMERTGYPDGKIPQTYMCQICGAEDVREIYSNGYQGVVGCEKCILKSDPWEILDNR